MDDLTDAVLSVQLADTTQIEPLFQLVCRVYQESATEGEADWDTFRARLTDAAAQENLSTAAETWTENLAQTTLSPLDVIAAMNEEGEARLTDMYAAGMAEAHEDRDTAPTDGSAEEYPEAVESPGAWNDYLAANGQYWDRTEEGWPQFRDWFLYYATEAGVPQTAKTFITYTEAQPDKTEVFREN